MKTFKIGNDRSLKLSKKNDSISIEDKGTKKAAHFTPARWASFLQYLDQIDDQLRRLSESEDVAYCMHYDGAWHVSLTKVFVASTYENSSYPRTRPRGSLQRRASPYVSTSGRRSSRPSTTTTRLSQTLHPALRPTSRREWDQLRAQRSVTSMGKLYLYLLNLDHTTPETCPECNPYPSTTA